MEKTWCKTAEAFSEMSAALRSAPLASEIATIFSRLMGPEEVVVECTCAKYGTTSLNERQLGILVAGLYALASGHGIAERVTFEFGEGDQGFVSINPKTKVVN